MTVLYKTAPAQPHPTCNKLASRAVPKSAPIHGLPFSYITKRTYGTAKIGFKRSESGSGSV